jgi:hypothetical protein
MNRVVQIDAYPAKGRTESPLLRQLRFGLLRLEQRQLDIAECKLRLQAELMQKELQLQQLLRDADDVADQLGDVEAQLREAELNPTLETYSGWKPSLSPVPTAEVAAAATECGKGQVDPDAYLLLADLRLPEEFAVLRTVILNRESHAITCEDFLAINDTRLLEILDRDPAQLKSAHELKQLIGDEDFLFSQINEAMVLAAPFEQAD